jgi:hypothetical protein
LTNEERAKVPPVGAELFVFALPSAAAGGKP